MKIGSFPMVARIYAARERLRAQRNGQARIVVMIDGTAQDAELVERVRPAVNAVIDERIDEFDRDLRALGVEVG